LKRDPKSIQARSSLEMFIFLKRISKSDELLRRVIQIAPNNPLDISNGSSPIGAEKGEGALPQFEKALSFSQFFGGSESHCRQSP